MEKSQDIRVEVKGLVPTPTGCGVFLGNGQKVIAIFVDHNVASAITMFLHNIPKARPLTHDLIVNILAGLGARVEKVVVNDLKDDTFYARIYLTQENELGRAVIEVDARPSDSIALAIQQKCPIYVSQSVWDATEDMSWALKRATSDGDGPTPDESAEGDEEEK